MAAILTTQTNPEKLFRRAVCWNQLDKMIELAPKVNVNAASKINGYTAVHLAAANGHASALRLLFNLGADFSLPNAYGQTAEQMAAGPAKVVFTLIKAGREGTAFQKRLFPKNFEKASTTEKNVYEAAMKLYPQRDLEFRNEINEPILAALRGEGSSEAELLLVKQAFRCNFYKELNLKTLKYLKTNNCQCVKKKEASAGVLTFLAQAPFTFLIEEIVLRSLQTNTRLIVFNRRQDLPLENRESWREAFVVDAYTSQFYFFDALSCYKKQSPLRDFDGFNLSLRSILNPPPAPFKDKSGEQERVSWDVRAFVAKHS